MRSFAIYDRDLDDKMIGVLFYFERTDAFVIELVDSLDEWTCPVLFNGYVRRGLYTIPANISRAWVEERIVPSERQNIGQILKNEKMSEYREELLLKRGGGNSSQDNCYVKEIKRDAVPKWVLERQHCNISECFYCDDYEIICLFNDNLVRRINIKNLADKLPDLKHILHIPNKKINADIYAGGYEIIINNLVTVDKYMIITYGELLEASAKMFYSFAEKNVINTSEACEILNCTRQNISYMINKDTLSPLKRGDKESLFYRGELYRE